jgi:hypothetical protein
MSERKRAQAKYVAQVLAGLIHDPGVLKAEQRRQVQALRAQQVKELGRKQADTLAADRAAALKHKGREKS